MGFGCFSLFLYFFSSIELGQCIRGSRLSQIAMDSRLEAASAALANVDSVQRNPCFLRQVGALIANFSARCGIVH
jgi:hypothetical protein